MVISMPKKSISLKILEGISMVHGCSIDTWISICVFSIHGLFGNDIAWTLQPGYITFCGQLMKNKHS